MSDTENLGDLEEHGEDLIKEFHQFGLEYPLLTKMFMDLVGVVGKQNEQIEEIVETLEAITNHSAKQDEIIKEHEWKLNILKENLMESFNEGFEPLTTSKGFSKKKKTFLN